MHALTRPRRDLLAELAVQFVVHITLYCPVISSLQKDSQLGRVPVCCVVVSAARRHIYGWIGDTRTVSEYMILQPACMHAAITVRIAAVC